MVRSSASSFLFFCSAGTEPCLFFRCTRSGSLNEHRQPNIPKSEYLQRLDDGEEDELVPPWMDLAWVSTLEVEEEEKWKLLIRDQSGAGSAP